PHGCPYDFESYASASSATSALLKKCPQPQVALIILPKLDIKVKWNFTAVEKLRLALSAVFTEASTLGAPPFCRNAGFVEPRGFGNKMGASTTTRLR
ncbi:MAG: hypothetical protein ACYC21_15315, partial [Eubacteriales bacterium]